MRIWDRKGFTLKSWLLLIPITAASLIAISRTMDYRHHSTDVLAGAIMGVLVAWYCYRQYYPVSMNSTMGRETARSDCFLDWGYA
jgi:diacylglycerol diphosphate phosphatase/phosphatidate phosphatase